ncbi:MAG: ATP-binding cassette domain-containing protein [Polynucleobacter sp.]
MDFISNQDRYLEISGLHKSWSTDKSNKSGISISKLNIRPREHVAVLGPSGSGKSTFLKLLAKDIEPNGGVIYFMDKPISDWLHHDLSFYRAVLPQAQELSFDFSVDLIVGLGCINHQNLSSFQVRALVKDCLKSAVASHLEGQSYMNLSGGEKARVQLARVFAQMWSVQDGLLLVDEPFAALDPYLQIALLSNLCEFANQRSLTVIAILHDVNHAMHYFDRGIFIREGQMSLDKPMMKVSRIDLENLYGIRFLELHADNKERYFFPIQADKLC